MKEGLKYIFLFNLLILLNADLLCQVHLESNFFPPDIRFDNYLINNGEASEIATCILIDRMGFLWCCTETEIYRYDGNRYRKYSIGEENKRSHKATRLNIFEDSKGRIWIGTSNGLAKLEKGYDNFTNFLPDTAIIPLLNNYIRSVNEDNEGLLWIRTNKDIFSFNTKSEKFTRFTTDSLSCYPQNTSYTPEINCFLADSIGSKWFITYKGLYRLNNRDKNFIKVLPDTSYPDLKGSGKINCINTDKKGNIWLGTESEGLLKWNFTQSRFEKIHIQPGGNAGKVFKGVSFVLPDHDGSIWAFGNSVFTKYNPGDDIVKNYTFTYNTRTIHESPSSPVWIDQAFQCSNGNLWFINKGAGLIYRFDPDSEQLSFYRTPNFIVFQCIIDHTESLWFACVRHDIFRLLSDQFPYLSLPVNNSSDVIQVHKKNIIDDDQNNIWILLNLGIYIIRNFDNKSYPAMHQFRFPNGDSTTGSGFKDQKGNLWFASKRGDILMYNPVSHNFKDLTPWNEPDFTEMGAMPLIQEDKAGNIWIATSYHGLFRLSQRSDKLEHILDFIAHIDRNSYNLLFDFLIDDNDDIWLLTGEAILKIKIPELKIINLSDSAGEELSCAECNIRIDEDSKRNIWLLNNINGLYVFDRSNNTFKKVNLINDENDDTAQEFFDMLIDRMDRIWIAHNRGITIYDPITGDKRLIITPRLTFDVQSFQSKSGYVFYINNDLLFIFKENVSANRYIPPVYITRLLVNGSDYNKILNKKADIRSLNKIDLPFNRNTLVFEFAALNYMNPEQNSYRYIMSRVDRDTVISSQGMPADYKNLSPGIYKFWVTGSNNDGYWNPDGVSMEIRIHPPWFKAVPAFIVYALIIIFLIYIYIRLRTAHLIRDKILLETEVKTRTIELEQKNRQLAETDRLKTHFFTDISHEIRTPLSLIIGPLENILNEELLSARLRGMIEIMRRNAQRLMNLVNQLLDISRLDAGKMKINLTKDNIVKYLRILVYDYLTLAESKHIKYIAELPEMEFITWFDRDKTEKIISNILLNAFKYTPQNGTVQCTVNIESASSKNDQYFLNIRILDSGKGISREHLSKIFDRFYRVEEHDETDGHGTGIGLSLVQEFVALLHGKIDVNSTQGKGSDFFVSIPLGKEHLSSDEYIIIEPSEKVSVIPDKIKWEEKYGYSQQKKADNRKLLVLVIEDNEDLRKYIREIMESEYRILEAPEGRTGINIAYTMMPDLIITDIMMPDLNGLQLCSQLKNDERTSHIPIVMLTAKTSVDDKIEGLKTGADDYVTKPFYTGEFKARISNILAQREKLKLKYSKLNLLSINLEITGSVDDRFVARIINIINENLKDHEFDVSVLERQIGMSRMHLSRKLKIITGLTPGTLIRNIRLEKAAELLLKKTGNITEIANSVGISNPSNFTKAFRNYFGVSPKRYTKQ
jgi:signal transduction histidine kinase/DNA-binding response OmpR family regulator/ligand-binding sensor domain-containing protein